MCGRYVCMMTYMRVCHQMDQLFLFLLELLLFFVEEEFLLELLELLFECVWLSSVCCCLL